MKESIILQSAGKNPDGTPIRAIVEATGYSIQTIHRLEKQGKFPARLQLGPARVGWLHSDVEAWLASRARGPLPAPHRDVA